MEKFLYDKNEINLNSENEREKTGLRKTVDLVCIRTVIDDNT